MKINSNRQRHVPLNSCTTVSHGQVRFFSTVLAIVFSAVLPMLATAAGPVVQLLWSNQPGSANVGSPFGRQPTLIAADAAGNPSTVGLAGTVNVTVDTIPAGGLAGGAQTVNIGTSGNNGVVVFSGLQINSAGGYALSATTGNGTNELFSPTNGINSCQLWLDASDSGTLTVTNETGNLSFWADKSGTANNATSSVANSLANTPLTNIDSDFPAFASGEQRVVDFYGTNILNIDLTRITNTTYTIIAVTELSPTETPNNDFYIGSPFYQVSNDGGVDDVLHIGYRNPTEYHWGQYADDLDVSPPAAGPVIASHVHAPGNKQIFLNGTLAGQNIGGQNNLLPVAQGTLGSGNGGFFHGAMAEMIIYRTNLTDLQRIGVENYLFNKWLGQLSAAVKSSSFFVGSGVPPAGLTFSQQPVNTSAGAIISPNVTVTVTNAAGAGIPNLSVALSVADGAGPLNGTLAQITDANGIAIFNDLDITNAGQYTLQAAIPGAVTNISDVFTIAPAAAAQLVLQPQPSSSATAGVAFETQPTVLIEDVYGNVVTTATDTIIASETGGGNLSGTAGNSVLVAAVNGTAVYSGLYVTNIGTQTITFTDDALTINSGNIAVVSGALTGSGLTVQQEPSATAQVGVVFGIQPIVTLADAYGNPATNGTPVTATASAGVLLGETTAYVNGGIATFNNLLLTNLGNITLTFSAGPASANSTPISVSVGPVSTVIWTTQPGSSLAGAPFGQQPVLHTADAGGNVTVTDLQPTNWVVVHLISGSGLVGETLTYNIGTSGSNGVISFKNLQINTGGTSNILAADFIGSITDPTNGIPNCILWLDAYDSSTLIDASTNLIEWADKSGTDNNATNTANYPETNLNASLPYMAYGGQHIVSFSGNNWLNVNLTPLLGTTYTVIALDIANTNSANGNSYFFGSDYDGVDGTLHMGYRTANTFTFAQYADDLNWTASANFSFFTPRIWTGRLDSSGNQDIFLNGTLEATRGANSYPVALAQGHVGQGNGGSYKGDLAEIIVYNRDLSDTERATVEQYLTHKWLSNSRGLTVPFTVTSLTPKLSIARGAGETVTLTLTGAPNTQYRLFAAPSLTVPFSSWTLVGTQTLDGTGVWQFTDTNNNSDKFYRAVTP